MKPAWKASTSIPGPAYSRRPTRRDQSSQTQRRIRKIIDSAGREAEAASHWLRGVLELTPGAGRLRKGTARQVDQDGQGRRHPAGVGLPCGAAPAAWLARPRSSAILVSTEKTGDGRMQGAFRILIAAGAVMFSVAANAQSYPDQVRSRCRDRSGPAAPPTRSPASSRQQLASRSSRA